MKRTKRLTRRTRLLLAGAAALALAFPLVRAQPALADRVEPPTLSCSSDPATNQCVLQVPPGNTPYLVGHAVGTQNYACSAAGTWSFVGPQAILYRDDEHRHRIATHFAVPGSNPPAPEWQARDGSSVVGKRVAGMAVDATAIPWLLLQAVSTGAGPDGGDRLAATTYIQRVNTTGGLAPAGSCTPGATANVPYTADYYFYRAADNEAGDE